MFFPTRVVLVSGFSAILTTARFCVYCDGVEARPRSGRRSAVAEIEMTGDAASHELTGWQGVGWILMRETSVILLMIN